jgi:hypothetical protein
MNQQLHDEGLQQPSLFSCEQHPQDKGLHTVTKCSQKTGCRSEYYVALDRLLDALRGLLSPDYPLSGELRRWLSNPDLELLIFEEMKRALELE